jgi:hypothetical protein
MQFEAHGAPPVVYEPHPLQSCACVEQVVQNLASGCCRRPATGADTPQQAFPSLRTASTAIFFSKDSNINVSVKFTNCGTSYIVVDRIRTVGAVTGLRCQTRKYS